MSIVGALAITVTGVAFAAPQAAEDELPSCPPGQEMTPPPAATQTTTTTTTTTQTTPPPATYETAPAPAPAPAPYVSRWRRNRIFAPGAVSFMLGGGVTDYFGRSVNGGGNIDPGATWDARFVFGTSSVIALEAGYLGSVNQVQVTGKDGQINSNGLDTSLRLQLPTRVQPYIFAGVGWNHMTLDNGDANPQVTRQFRQKDDQFVVPAGAGLTGYVGRHLSLDVRGTYRLIPNQEIVIGSDRALHQWMAQARVGYVF
jgi:hypothetical protein